MCPISDNLNILIKFIKLNPLYTTYKEQLQIYNWLIKQHVSALFGHHRAYKRWC